MRKIDKATLLFEYLLGPDMTSVNRKIEEIKMSKEYVRVANFIPSASSTQILADVKERFNAIDIYAILSLEKALHIEKEIKELDRRLSSFPSINPYLASFTNDYHVKRVGQVAIEINSEGMALNDLTNNGGLTAANRKKVLKTKVFNWYKEAKKGLADMADNSKMMLSKIRNSTIRFTSINLQHYVLIVAAVICLFAYYLLPNYKTVSLDLYPVISTIGLYVLLICVVLSSILKVIYKTYPYRMASKLSQQVKHQDHLIDELASKSYRFEKSLISSAKVTGDVKMMISKISILNNKETISNSELFEYVYSEKEYYIAHYRWQLIAHCVIFAIGFMVAAIIIALGIVF